MKCAIYARVSTDEQTVENQIKVLTEYAERQRWEVAEVYQDTGSAFQHTDQKQLTRLLSECQRRGFEMVLVYDVSRLSRKGPLELMNLLRQFANKNAPVHSYLDQAINVPSEFQPVLVALYGMMARIFSTQLSQRTKAGMARAKAAGKHVGRPRKKGLE
jgi:DNA invertase Pin-like site-specific DNA recombinase